MPLNDLQAPPTDRARRAAIRFRTRRPCVEIPPSRTTVKSVNGFWARSNPRCSQARNRDCRSRKAHRNKDRIGTAHVRSPLVSTLNTWDHGQTGTAMGVDGDFPEKSRPKAGRIGRISPRNAPRIRAPNKSIEPCHHPGPPLSASPKRIRVSQLNKPHSRKQFVSEGGTRAPSAIHPSRILRVIHCIICCMACRRADSSGS